MRIVLVVVCLALALFTRAPQAQAPSAAAPPARAMAPKLIVFISVDQMRGDYIDKFRHQWTKGLKRLVSEGAWFREADYPYFNTVTCAGHASMSTGKEPHWFSLEQMPPERLRRLHAFLEEEYGEQEYPPHLLIVVRGLLR